jgi:hypothetical protein
VVLPMVDEEEEEDDLRPRCGRRIRRVGELHRESVPRARDRLRVGGNDRQPVGSRTQARRITGLLMCGDSGPFRHQQRHLAHRNTRIQSRPTLCIFLNGKNGKREPRWRVSWHSAHREWMGEDSTSLR